MYFYIFLKFVPATSPKNKLSQTIVFVGFGLILILLN